MRGKKGLKRKFLFFFFFVYPNVNQDIPGKAKQTAEEPLQVLKPRKVKYFSHRIKPTQTEAATESRQGIFEPELECMGQDHSS